MKDWRHKVTDRRGVCGLSVCAAQAGNNAAIMGAHATLQRADAGVGNAGSRHMAIKARGRSVPKVSQKAVKPGAQAPRLGRKPCGNGATTHGDERFHPEVAGEAVASGHAFARIVRMLRSIAGGDLRQRRPAQAIVLGTLMGSLACSSLFAASTAAQQAPEKPVVHDIQEMAKALDACIRPLAVTGRYRGIRIAARLGFNSRGQPLGPPRFTYVTPQVPERIKNEYKTAILDALVRCTPVPFSRQLGATIAGVPFVLSFDERGLMNVRLAGSSVYAAPAPLPSSRSQPVRRVLTYANGSLADRGARVTAGGLDPKSGRPHVMGIVIVEDRFRAARHL